MAQNKKIMNSYNNIPDLLFKIDDYFNKIIHLNIGNSLSDCSFCYYPQSRCTIENRPCKQYEKESGKSLYFDKLDSIIL